MERINVRMAVIGAGASGYAAAIGASEKAGSGSGVLLLEKQQKTGRKLLATGNGRCNISNENVSPEHYHGDGDIIGSVTESFTVGDMKAFLESMGVLTRSDSEGRIYPHSNQAVTVLDALRREASRLGVKERCSFVTRNIKKEKGCFILTGDDAEIRCEKLIIATGSKAAPHLGADGSGLELLDSLGVGHTEPYPALCPVSTEEKYAALKGVRAKGRVTLIADGKPFAHSDGEIQFTDGALSGICVFDLSGYVNEYFIRGTINGTAVKKIQIAADLMTDMSFMQLTDYLGRCRRIFGSTPAVELLSGALNVQLSRVIAGVCGLSGKTCGGLDPREIKQLAACTKKLLFTPSGMSGFKTAQVCAGGVPSAELHCGTLMSRKHKGLYICGELLDVYGDCGGYNLHFAVGSGLKAGRAASE